MEIEKKDIEKLNQLTRIEFYLKQSYLERADIVTLIFFSIYVTIIETTLILLKITKSSIFWFVGLSAFILVMYYSIKRIINTRKKGREIESQYFEVKPHGIN